MDRRSRRWGVVLAAVGLIVGAGRTATGQGGGTVLGIEGTRFTLDGKPAFLLGMSYYGGLGADEAAVRRDLDDLRAAGFRWVRVWATWAEAGDRNRDVSAVDTEGNPRGPYLERLRRLLAECDRRGMVVDVTLTRGQGAGRLRDQAAHRRAVELLVTRLRAFRNWYLDLANERDVRDDRYVSVDELRVLRDLARRLDPGRPVTASTGGHVLEEADIREARVIAGLDFLTPHLPRDPGSPRQTEARTRAALAVLKRLGLSCPVHYQEPLRRGYGKWEPTADDFLTDLEGALRGGAAGWCLHNGDQRGRPDRRPRRSFDLSDARLFDQLDQEEKAVARRAGALVARSADHAPARP